MEVVFNVILLLRSKGPLLQSIHLYHIILTTVLSYKENDLILKTRNTGLQHMFKREKFCFLTPEPPPCRLTRVYISSCILSIAVHESNQVNIVNIFYLVMKIVYLKRNKLMYLFMYSLMGHAGLGMEQPIFGLKRWGEIVITPPPSSLICYLDNFLTESACQFLPIHVDFLPVYVDLCRFISICYVDFCQ